MKFKQKNFFWPAIGVAGTVVTGADLINSSVNASEQEERDEKTQELMREQNKRLEKINKAINAHPAAATNFSQRSYSGGLLAAGKTLFQAGKSAFGKEITNTAIMGGSLAAAGYGVNKFIQHDMKKSGMQFDEAGNLIMKEQQYADVPVSAAAAGKQGGESVLKKVGGKLAGNAFMPTLFAAPTLAGYYAEKNNLKDQMAATGGEQRSYSILSGIGKFAKMATKPKEWQIFKTPGQTISGTVNNLASLGLGGTERVNKFAQELQKFGEKNGNTWLADRGRYLAENKTAANLITAVPLMGVGSLAWSGAENVAKKAFNTVDKNAYQYENAKAGQVQ